MEIVAKSAKDYLTFAELFLFHEVDCGIVRSAYHDNACTCWQFEAGEQVYSKIDFQKSMGLVLSGELKACKPSNDGSDLLLNTFFMGSVFGVASLFNDAQEYVSEITAVKRSRILFLPQILLKNLLHRDMHFVENYISYLSNRICFLNSRIGDFAGGTVEDRLLNLLLTLSAQSTDPYSFSLPFTLTELSNRLDIGRASLYRAFDALEKAEILVRKGRHIIFKEIGRTKEDLSKKY